MYAKRLMCFVSIALVGGCGTLFNSSTNAIAVSSTPSEADVYVNGNLVGATPISVELDNHQKAQTITVNKDGFREATCTIATGVGAGWVILDILGGLFPLIIDAATGEWRSVSDAPCNVTLATE